MISNFRIDIESTFKFLSLSILLREAKDALCLSSRSCSGRRHLAEEGILTLNIYIKASLMWGWQEPLSESDAKEKFLSLEPFACDRGGMAGLHDTPSPLPPASWVHMCPPQRKYLLNARIMYIVGSQL